MSILNTTLTKREIKDRNFKFDPGRIYMAEVMDTRSITNSGEIKVWVVNSGIPRNASDKWVIASYASPLYGTTNSNNINGTEKNEYDYNDAPTSFGLIFPMTFVGNYVFIFYPCVTGQNVRPYWFACPMNMKQSSMLPGYPNKFKDGKEKGFVAYEMNLNGNLIGSSDKKPSLSTFLEDNENDIVLKYQRYQIDVADEDGTPAHPLSKALQKQGLSNDKLRGISTASWKRETPSQVYGIATPLGNTFTMDDGWSVADNNISWYDDVFGDKPLKEDEDLRRQILIKELRQEKIPAIDKNNPINTSLPIDKQNWDSTIPVKESKESNKVPNDMDCIRFHGGFRFRTRNGTQIMIFDNGTIYMINRDGTAWLELSDDGYIDCFSEKGIDARSNGDINLYNLRYEKDEEGNNVPVGSVNIESANINLKAANCIKLESPDIEMISNHQIKMSATNTDDDKNKECSIDITTPEVKVADNINLNGQLLSKSVRTKKVETEEFATTNGGCKGEFKANITGRAKYADGAGDASDMSTADSDEIDINDNEYHNPNKTTTIHINEVVQQVSLDKEKELLHTINTRVPCHEPYEGHNRNNGIPDVDVVRKTKKKPDDKKDNTVVSNTVSTSQNNAWVNATNKDLVK